MSDMTRNEGPTPAYLAKLHQDMLDATKAQDTLQEEKDSIDRRLTTARNKVNDSQKALDAAMASLVSNAPRDSDWYRRSHATRFELPRITPPPSLPI